MSYPMIEARAHGGRQSYVWRIVMHATVSPCERGGARANAAWFQNPASGTSAHYVVDPGEIVQCLPEDVIGYHDGRNVNEIGIELTDPQSGSGSRWSDPDHEAMLVRAAELVRGVAARWHFKQPLIRGTAPLPADAERICGHVDVTNTWHCSTHTDPGPDFPWGHFMGLIEGKTAKPAVAAGPKLLGGVLTSAPAIVSMAPGRLDAFGRGTSDALYHAWSIDSGKSWHGWENLGGKLTSDPSACSDAPNSLHVVVTGTDRAVYHRWWDGRWCGYERLGGVLLGAPSITSDAPGRLTVAGTGTNHTLYLKTFDHGWHGWTPAAR